MDISLSLEQKFQLRQLASELAEASREKLFQAALENWEERMVQLNYFRWVLEMAGVDFEEESDIDLALPETEEEMIDRFGHTPSNEELEQYISERIEACTGAARMDVDIEAIVLGLDG